MLYIVATPIGNLADLSLRAQEILRSVTVIAAEDTRHSRHLLQHYGINTPLISLHSHNEKASTQALLSRLQAGESMALVSDAGTPLISDPGFDLVRAARQQGINVSPIPGPCAAITALSAAGLPCDRFIFEGFLPATTLARSRRMQELQAETRTLIYYEAPHRILAMLSDAIKVFGETRYAVIAREVTKQFETFYIGTLIELYTQISTDPHATKGEIVVLLAGQEGQSTENIMEGQRVLKLMLKDLPLKQAVKLTAEITGLAKNKLYQWAISDFAKP